ncbi:MFS transporter [Photobacterium sp. S4TG1]|uniref:MFS transporter n=1 Tax=Photobacterium sp. S4TG1 TaxID=3114587 RepID=UPI002E16D9EA|nr:MFS transporter [Photobacterium sp. S4TG1]
MQWKNIMEMLKSSFGNVIEWYDFCLFGYFASTIGDTFFSNQSKFTALLFTFATFAVGFLARPIGGFIFGWIGDKVGRYYSMNLAILIMGAATSVVALLPSYQSIGIVAPILLVIIRILQGLSAGGQFANLLVVTSEDDSLKNKGFYTGIALAVSVLGFLLASVVSYIVINILPNSWSQYSWRIAFAIGGILLAIYYFYVRSDIKVLSKKEKVVIESESHDNTYLHLWRLHKLNFVISTVLSAVVCVIFYLDFIYFVTFFTQYSNLSLEQSLIINSVMLTVACILYPLFGFLSDKIGRAQLTSIGIVLHIVLLPFIFKLIFSNDLYNINAAMLMLTVCLCVIQAAATPIFSEIFPAKVRSSGCCASYGLGAAVSGVAPMLAIQITHYHIHNLIYIFAIVLIIGLICIFPLIFNVILNHKSKVYNFKNV